MGNARAKRTNTALVCRLVPCTALLWVSCEWLGKLPGFLLQRFLLQKLGGRRSERGRGAGWESFGWAALPYSAGCSRPGVSACMMVGKVI